MTTNLDEITRVAHTNAYEWQLGPDEIIPSDSFYSSKLNIPVKIRSKEIDGNKFPIKSIYSAFKHTLHQKPDHPAIAFKNGDNWNYFTYADYWKLCNQAANSFIKLGLEPNQVVTILGFNSPQWFISALGSIFACGISCGIYTTNGVEACEFIFNDTQSEICVVENKQQLDKILKCKIKFKKIIQYTGTVEDAMNGLVLSWQQFIDFGKDLPDEYSEQRIKLLAPNKCATLIYTSGTTGNPKAAMISHDNIVYLAHNMCNEQSKLRMFEERFVSYLPLSHIAAQAVDIYASIVIGGTTFFAQPDALKGTIVQTLKEAKPTFFFGVPRVWEKFQDQIEKIMKTTLTGTKLKLFKFAQNAAYKHIISLYDRNESFSFSFYIAKKLVLNKIYASLGLDECRSFHSGAAPIMKETLEFFARLGIPLTETYGMSESCGPHSVGTVFSNRLTSVGAIDQFNRSKVINKDQQDGSGELCLYGRHIFMGYLNEEAKTLDTFDQDGWLRTGDISKIDSDGFIFITGRLKELIITAGGENIAPIPIEDRIKAEMPGYISNCILIGDKRKYLVVLVCLKCMVDVTSGEPLDDLTQDCISWLQSIGSSSTKTSDIIDHKDELVYKEIENGIKRANKLATSRAAVVQKFEILPRDFSQINGELGPTLKLRRPIVTKIYASYIDKLYADNEEN